MSELYYGPPYSEPIDVLPLALQQAQLATPTVLVKGGEPAPVTVLVEVEVSGS